MVGRTRRGKRKQNLLGNHQRSWIWGRNAVLETLRHGKWTILELVLATSLDEESQRYCSTRAEELGVSIQYQEAKQLTARCHSAEHQGLLARMSAFPYADEQEILNSLPNGSLTIVLDSIQDPYNFGAMVRTFAAFGIESVFISEHNQVGVNSLVARASAGAVNMLPIVRVVDLESLLIKLQQLNIRCYATSAESEHSYSQKNYCNSTAFVIGNEGRGVSTGVASLCHDQISIPLSGQIDSLNAAVAAGILVSEAHRQRLAQKAVPCSPSS